MNNIKVPYINLISQNSIIKKKLLESVGKVISHGGYILGPEVKSFEKEFSDYCGTKYAIGVDNGTSALILVLKALSIGHGDEVITVPNSFLASASCIALIGAKPVFVDIQDDYNINPNLIEKAITSKTKAIIPVHLTGHPAEMNAILNIAKKHNLHVIEDCAQAVGAAYYEKRVGGFGIAGCFSLHPLKNLNAIGDGGVIVTNDTQLYEKLLKARNHGLINRDECEFWSINSRLDTIQAAMLLVKMKYLDKWIKKRRGNAEFYKKRISKYVKVPKDKDYEFSVYHTFVVQAENREELMKYLLDKGIETKIHYPIPIHLQQASNNLGYKIGDFPQCDNQVKKILSLPVYPELTIEQIELVADSIKSFYEQKTF
ncbi:MAG: cell wall biogenesis protein [Elusimicrobia bacterium RIFOXYD2_FULL_34_15]|nr:MAG: cell wall biogenesis protein [Elusimicrobia bacterium RIFOXYD2_FULL_34_15]